MTNEYEDSADIRIILGDQRKGKSTLATMFAVDAYIEEMTGLVSPEGEKCDARCLTDTEVEKLERKHVSVHKATHCVVFNEDHSQSKIIKFPSDAMIESPVKIFANYTFYGVYYVPLDFSILIQHLNTDLLKNAWVLMDESTMTDARNSMTREGKLVAQFGATAAKRKLHLISIVQYYTQIEARYKLFQTTSIECKEYDKLTQMVYCSYRKGGDEVQDTEVYVKPYQRYFDTHEVPQIPQHQIDLAMEKMNK